MSPSASSPVRLPIASRPRLVEQRYSQWTYDVVLVAGPFLSDPMSRHHSGALASPDDCEASSFALGPLPGCGSPRPTGGDGPPIKAASGLGSSAHSLVAAAMSRCFNRTSPVGCGYLSPMDPSGRREPDGPVALPVVASLQYRQ